MKAATNKTNNPAEGLSIEQEKEKQREPDDAEILSQAKAIEQKRAQNKKAQFIQKMNELQKLYQCTLSVRTTILDGRINQEIVPVYIGKAGN